MKISTSSGTLRNDSTYSPPMRFSQELGATRKAATSVPTAIAITNDTTTSSTVVQNPRTNSSKFSVRVSRTAKGTLDGSEASFCLTSSTASATEMSGGSASVSVYWPTHLS